MNEHELIDRITAATGASVIGLPPLSGGCVGEVYRVHLKGADDVVAKVDRSDAPRLDIEAMMLRYLGEKSELPVPQVILGDADLLLIEYIEHDGQRGRKVDIEAADALAALHEIGAEQYGFPQDTLIGGLNLPNQQCDDWVEFFAEYRLRDMARRCLDAEMLDQATVRRVEALADRLDEFIERPNPPALIHGDIWGGNVLVDQGRLKALIDPAIYYADPEVELAFIDMFNTFGPRFYDRYSEHRPIAREFFEIRRQLYNLFPILVHIRLFGGTYVRSLRSTLGRLGV